GPAVHRVAAGAVGVNQTERRAVGRRVTGDVTAGAVVVPVDELAVAEQRVSARARPRHVERGLPVREVGLREIPAAVRRVVLPRRTARVGDAVALGEGGPTGLPLDAADGRATGDDGAHVEEVGVSAADALVLEVAVDDGQREALAAVAGLR